MQRIEKTLFYQGLKDYPVYKEDTDNTIFNVINVPDVFPQGKSYFLMLGSKELKQDSDVLVEILDSTGQVIYYEIPKYLENAGRAISVWIYDHIVPGEAFVTIVGELSHVPQVWKNKPNVKRTFRIFVNPQLKNKQPIKFNKLPEVTASYVDKNYLVFSEEQTVPVVYNLSSSNDGFFGFRDQSAKRRDLNQKYTIVLVNEAFPPYTPNRFVQSSWLGAEFSTGEIEFADGELTQSYKGKITKLTGTASFEISPALGHYDEDPPIEDTKAYAQNATITYYSTATGSPTELTASFAELKIKDLFTFSGEVDTIKVYKQNVSSDTSYHLLGQYSAEPMELLIKSGSINYSLGTFDSTGSLLNWTFTSTDGKTFDDPPHFSFESPIIENSSENIFNAVKLIPRYAYFKSPLDPPLVSEDARRFKFFPKNFSIPVVKGHEYTVTAKYACEPVNLVFNDTDYITTNLSASLGIYVSGSAIIPDKKQGYGNNAGSKYKNDFGKQIGFLTSPGVRNFGEVSVNFVSDLNGVVNISYTVFSGIWYIADISVVAATDPGFNADELTIYAPLMNLKRDELAKFKIEFLNSAGDVCSDVVETSRPITLVNQPVYIEKNDNLVLGKLSIGRSVGSGIVVSGDTGSVIKSNTYEGKLLAKTAGSGGFIQYSGSALPGYSGVGFELDAGYNSGSLQFRFDPVSGSYLIISASIFALSGSNLVSGGGSGVGGLWTQSEGSASIHRLGDVEITGSLFILGDFVYVSSSIIYSSGSTKFGDTLGDSHEFTGSVNITGALNIDGPITSTEYFPTASWAISASWAANADTHFYGGIASQSFGNSVTWSFAHNLDTKYVIIQTYDTNSFQIIPSNIKLIDNNNAEIYFTPANQGIALASIGGSSIIKQATIALACSDETSPLTASLNAATFYMPYELHILNIKASLNATGSESCSIDVKRNGSTLFTSPLIISASEFTGSLVPTSSYLAEDSRITVDILSTGTGSAGLKVYIMGY